MAYNFMEFKDKRVILTGGTKGLGKAIALSFAREGAWVGVNYSSDDESASRTEVELEGLAINSLRLKADVSIGSDVERMIGSVLDEWEYWRFL